MTMHLEQILPPPAPPPPRDKAEGKLREIETLAIFLATSHNVADPPLSRIEMHQDWLAKDELVRSGYMIRARRILKAWGT